MYPEHQKLRAVKDQSQRVGEFIDWLREEGMEICEFDPTAQLDNYTPTRTSTQRLLARFFEIDLDKLEDEKRAMLEEQRALNEPGPS